MTPDLVGSQRMELPDGLAAQVFTPSDDVVVLGSVAVESMSAGDLVHRSDVRAKANAELTPFEMSFRIDSDRAVAGSLRAGEVVDVIATSGTAATAVTETILRDVVIVDVQHAGDSSLAGNRQVITIALDLATQAERMAHAVDQADLTLVRSRGTR